MMQSIKPCPFCKNSAQIVGIIFSYRVKCMTCKASTGEYETKEEAVAIWNDGVDEWNARKIVPKK